MSVDPSVNNRYIPANMAELMSRRMRDVSSKINCHTIGTIVSFDATKQMVSVSVNFQRTIKAAQNLNTTGESADVIVSYPVLVNVPIVVLQGGGGYLTFPIVAGDTCLLLFCDRDIDVWIEAGLVNPPPSERLHDLNDAIALVGLNNLQDVIAGYSTTKVSLSFPTGLVTVNDETGERLTQAGFLQAYAGSSAPSGWLLCYGQAVSRTTYATLFAVIGTTYGVGDGTTTFNVPDLRGRIPVGLDNMGGSNANVLTNAFTPNRNTLGGTIGEQTHTLTIAEMPAHTHTYLLTTNAANGSPGSGETQTNVAVNTGSTGGDGAHYNVQPGMMTNWLIKT